MSEGGRRNHIADRESGSSIGGVAPTRQCLRPRYEDGSLGTITSGYYNPLSPSSPGKHSHVKIWGSGGWLEINFEPIANQVRWFL